MIVHEPREKPVPWPEFRSKVRRGWTIPFLATEYVFEWAVYCLSHWSFLEALEYLSSLSVLIAVIFYFAESGDRVKQRHYQAWQVINTAQGKGGSGGRIEALQELNEDKVPLTGVDVGEAYLNGLRLDRAKLMRANFHNADVRNSSFRAADLSDSSLSGANFRNSDLNRASLHGADVTDADLTGSNLAGADLTGASLDNADLRGANLQNVRWNNIGSVKMTNLSGVQNADAQFIRWALAHGAVQVNSPQQVTKSVTR